MSNTYIDKWTPDINDPFCPRTGCSNCQRTCPINDMHHRDLAAQSESDALKNAPRKEGKIEIPRGKEHKNEHHHQTH